MLLSYAAGAILCASSLPVALAYTHPLAQPCPNFSNVSNVICINNYAASMPPDFSRPSSSGGTLNTEDTFIDTSVPSDPSFNLVKSSQFIVFDAGRGLDILGSTPTYEFVFNTRNDSIHEAPVYVPALNSIIYSLAAQGIYEQQIVNLNGSQPTLSNYTTNPPVYAANGGRLYNGSIYWAAEAGMPFPSPTTGQTILQKPGIYRLDPVTGQVETLLNNYFGKQFNSPNDLVIDSSGDIWFTDSWYGYGINVTAYPVLPPATYRFRPSTGHVSVVDSSIPQPNGIAISPDGRTLYLTDTGITAFSPSPPPGVLPRYTFNLLGGNDVYAYDIVYAPPGNYITSKRPIYSAETFADDGFHVSRDGYLIGAEGAGVSVLSAYGELLVRINTNFTVNNIQFAGADREDLWLFGQGGISRVRWNLKGMLEE